MSNHHDTPFDDLVEGPASRPTQALPHVSPPRSRGGKLPVPTAELDDFGDLPPDNAAFPSSQSTPRRSTLPAHHSTGTPPKRLPTSVLVGASVVSGALLVVIISVAMNALIPKPPLNSDGLVGEEQPRVTVVPNTDEELEIIPGDDVLAEPPAENVVSGDEQSASPAASEREETNAATDTPAVSSSGRGEVFRHAEKGYRVTPPAGFTLQQQGRRTIWKGPEEAQFLVETTSSPQGSPREGWERLDKSLARKYGSRYRNLGIRETTLAGRPAAVWEFEIDDRNGATTRKIDIGVHHGGTGYAVLAAAPVARFEEMRPQLEQAVRSLQLPEKSSRPRQSTPVESTPDETTTREAESEPEVFDGY